VLARYREIKQPVSVVVSKKYYENMGFTPTAVIDDFVPIGVNIVAKGEDYLYITKGKVAININTKKDLEMIKN
jgi:GTP:adenosylcobinamide-phosphate guanylyltransferase